MKKLIIFCYINEKYRCKKMEYVFNPYFNN